MATPYIFEENANFILLTISQTCNNERTTWIISQKEFLPEVLKDFFVISRKDLDNWKKEHYERGQQMRYTTREENEAYDKEWERKNKRR